jgi:hypothetical protein
VLLSMDQPKGSESKPTAPSCSPGETRACVGAGACKGGQACLPDGKGFGSCDCGPTTPPAPVTPDQPAPPVGASPADPVTGVPTSPSPAASAPSP